MFKHDINLKCVPRVWNMCVIVISKMFNTFLSEELRVFLNRIFKILKMRVEETLVLYPLEKVKFSYKLVEFTVTRYHHSKCDMFSNQI